LLANSLASDQSDLLIHHPSFNPDTGRVRLRRILPIDNRTVLTLLNALQVLEESAGAQLHSSEALDVEQVGHVYEGLLERIVKRVL
jgi:hypothetical protein